MSTRNGADMHQCFSAKIDAVMKLCGNAGDHVPLDEMLLPMDSVELRRIVNSMNIPEDQRDQEYLWVPEHEIVWRDHGYPKRPSNRGVSAFQAKLRHKLSQSMFSRLPRRAQEVVMLFTMLHQRRGIDGEWTVDVSQGLKRLNTDTPKIDFIGCLTGSCIMWMVKRQRLLVGLEELRFQGMSVCRVPSIEHQGNCVNHDMAGNAFTGPTAFDAFLSVGGACA